MPTPHAPALHPGPPSGAVEALPLPAALPPVVHRGAPSEAPPVATLPPLSVSPGGDVTLNFADADIREVVRAVIGDTLGLNYAIDPKVQGTITVRTGRPLPRAAVLPTMERVLRAAGAVLDSDNGFIRVMPLDTAAKGAAPGTSSPIGYGVRVLPLQYMPADSIEQLLQPFVPQSAVLQADTQHNVLVLSGTREDLDRLAELVRSFDTDWLSRASFALIPLRAVTADTIMTEMNAILSGPGAGAQPSDALRLVPVPRLQAVLAIAAEPRTLDWARQQIATLDNASVDGAERTYVYHVQHGPASDLAEVLGRVFGVATAGAAGAAAGPRATAGGTSSSAADSPFGFGTMGQPAGGFGGNIGAGTLPGGASTPQSSNGLQSAAPLSGALGQGQSGPAAPGTAAPNATGSSPAVMPGATPGLAQTGARGENEPPLRIVADERNNDIVVVTTEREYRRVSDALRRIDVKPLQVEIEATIAEVTLNDTLQYGLQWFFRQHNNSEALTNVATGTPAQSFPGFSYMFADTNIQVVLNALEAISNVKVVSSPDLVVLNNQTAELQVGQQVPVPVESEQSTLLAGAPLVNTINYINVGVILQVTPRANANGEVTLDLEQEVSDCPACTAAEVLSTTAAPVINERRIKSTISVEDGEGVALGGLIQDSVTLNRSAIPLLGDIPVVGALFRNDQNIRTRTELLVLLEPHIIANSDDARAATQDLLRRMPTIEPLGPHAH